MNESLLRDVVVGLDGSCQSRQALDWARSEVGPEARIHAVHVIAPIAELALDAALGDSVMMRHRRELSMRTEWLDGIAAADDRVVPQIREGGVASSLMAVADDVDAEAVVVGHHPHARFGPRFVGHVAADLLHHSDRPVIVVPDAWASQDGDGIRPVVVGVGVASGTRAAVRWALDHAGGVGLSLVHAFGPRSLFRPTGVLDVLAYHLDPHVLPEWVEEDLMVLADEVRVERSDGEDVEVTLDVAHGRTGPVLVEAGERARALVIGRSEPAFLRRHAIAPYLRYALVNAACPVVVVPAGPDEGDQG